MTNKAAEPEMWLSMSSKKVAWSCSRTKRYNVPTSEKLAQDKIAKKYWQRKPEHEHLNFLQWLHAFDHSKGTPKPYCQGTTLVGTKMYSIFNPEYFFQYTLLHIPHRRIEETFHPNHSRIPVRLQWYAQVIHNFPHMWTSSERLKYHFTLEGHKDTYVTTIISYILSLADLFYLTQMDIINGSQLQTLQPRSEATYQLDDHQIAVKTHIVNAIIARHTHYFSQNINFSIDSDNEYSDSGHEDLNVCNLNQPDLHHFNSDIQWQKPTLITGKPGSGKSHTILACVDELIEGR